MIPFFRSRWQAAKTTADQWTTKMESLVESWNSFNILIEGLKNWMETQEKFVNSKIEVNGNDMGALNKDLAGVKEILQGVSKKQAELIALTKDGDKVGSSLNQEGSSRIRKEIGDLRQRISVIAESAQNKLELLSQAINDKQEVQAKLDNFNDWIGVITQKIDDLSEIDVDKTDSALETAHIISQEIQDKKPMLDKMKIEITSSNSSDIAEDIIIQFQAITRQHTAALDTIEDKKMTLTKWTSFLSWQTESLALLKHIQQYIYSHQVTPTKLETISGEIENIAVQCQTRKIEGTDYEEASQRSNTHVVDKDTKKELSILILVSDILQQIVKLKKLLEEKKGKQQDLESRWEDFRQAEQKLAEWLQILLSRVQKISVKGNSVKALEDASSSVGTLVKENEANAHLKNDYHDLGRFLMQHDPSQLKSIQDAITEAESKWNKIANLLIEQQSKSQTLITMWKQCQDSKNTVVSRLDEVADNLEALNQTIPQNVDESAKNVDKCKESFSILKKTRQPFEAYYKRQTQLISELQTVPGFDTSPLKKELSQVQQQFSLLGEKLTKKLNSLDSQLVLWKQVEQQADDMLNWLMDSKVNMKEALSNITDSELATMKMKKFRSELQTNVLQKETLVTKINQIKEHNNNQDVKSLSDMLEKYDAEMKETKKCASELENALGNIGESSQMIKEEIKSTIEEMNKLREDLLKCEDSSGSDEQIYDRLKTATDLQEELCNYEDKISRIQEKIKSVQSEYGSEDRALIKDFQMLVKKHENINNQCNKVVTMLNNVLEKHYVDKVKELTKFNNTFKDKISWCLPEPSGDRFSTECKLESLSEIENAVNNMKPILYELEICGKVIMKIVDEDKSKDINSTMTLLNDQIQFIEAEVNKIKSLLSKNIETWRKFEESQENISVWLKETEETIRMVTASQVSIENFDKEKQKLNKIQNEINQKENVISELTNIAKDIIQDSPESKVDQQVQVINQRYKSVSKSLTAFIKKLDGVFQSRETQKDAIKTYKEWLESSKQKLKQFEAINETSVQNQAGFDAKLKELRSVLAEKEVGHEYLEKAIEAGEILFSEIAKEDRDKMRTEIRGLRDSWEAHIDYMSFVNKKLESIMIKLSNFDESLTKTQTWLTQMKQKCSKELIGGNLSEKKSIHQMIKSINQEIISHGSVIVSLKKLETVGGDDSQKKLTSVCQEYEKLATDTKTKLDKAQKNLAEHEKFSNAVEKTKDLMNSVNLELIILTDVQVDSDDMEKRLDAVEAILNKRKEGQELINQCHDALKNVEQSTTSEGYEVLKSELKELEGDWNITLDLATKFKDSQEKIGGKMKVFKDDLEKFSNWLKQMETRLKDQPMRKDVQSKTHQYNSLVELQNNVDSQSNVMIGIMKTADNLDLESDIRVKISQVSHRYESLKVNTKEVLKKYDSYIKEHKNFDEEYNTFIAWITALREDIKKHGEIVGDFKILQERRSSVEDMEEMKTNESLKFDCLIEKGEKLYPHTSPDGKENIRAQLKVLRKDWESLGEELDACEVKIDTCLQRFTEFTNSQEQLTKWLKDIEKHMQTHTELKASLQEKKAQLQNHKIVHQEVTSHNSLVETVCSKAQELVDQTQDKSLNVYIDSIRALFKNIGIKSGDLMEKLNNCVNDHTSYQTMISTFSDFTSNQSDILSQCADTSGEKSDLERKNELVNELRNKKQEGDVKMEELEGMCHKVAKSTSSRGNEKLRRELNEIKESWSTHLQLIEGVEMNLEKVIAQWGQFDNDLKKHQEWFKLYEGIFRNQQLQNDGAEKKAKLEEYRGKRKDIINYEKTIDDFVNNSHNLLHNSGMSKFKKNL